MSCYSPMVILKNYSNNGSKDFKFLGKAENLDFLLKYSDELRQRLFFDNNYILVPCGNCIGCRLDYSRTWAERMVCESFDKEAIFVTCTYDDEFIPVSSSTYFTISDDDISLFIRDLRNHYRHLSLRYALASEYGDELLRPHFHLILYGLNFDELASEFYKLNDLGHPMFKSDILSNIWAKGFVVIERGNYYNMAYTARYILKKQKGEASSEYSAFGLEPPKFRMSRRPGIGADWFYDNYKQLYTDGYISCSRSVLPSGKILPNRYFNKLLDKVDPDLLAHYNAKVKCKSFDFFKQKELTSSMDLENVTSYLEFEKKNFLSKNNFSRNC